jgi:hypothetical protein
MERRCLITGSKSSLRPAALPAAVTLPLALRVSYSSTDAFTESLEQYSVSHSK